MPWLLSLLLAASASAAQSPNFGFIAPKTGEMVVYHESGELRSWVIAVDPTLLDVEPLPKFPVRALQGHRLLVYFWGPPTAREPGLTYRFCPDCGAVMDRMDELQRRYPSDLQVVGLGYEGWDLAVASAAAYTHLIGGYRGRAAEALGIRKWPGWALIDADGTIFANGDKPIDWDDLYSEIDAMIAGKGALRPPSPPYDSAIRPTPPPKPAVRAADFAVYCPTLHKVVQLREKSDVGEAERGRAEAAGNPLEILEGHPVLLYFWDHKIELAPLFDGMERLHDRYLVRGLRVVGMGLESFASAGTVAMLGRYSHRVGVSYSGTVAYLEYHIPCAPSWALIDAKGTIRASGEYSVDWGYLEHEIQGLLPPASKFKKRANRP